MILKNPGICSILVILLFASSCSAVKKLPAPAVESPVVVTAPIPVDSTRTDAFLEDLMKQYPQYFDSILQNRNNRNVQIIFTQVDKGANGIAVLKHYYFNVNSARYFYPASTVKFPVSILALQKLNELKIKGLDLNTTMVTGQAYSGQTPVYNDPTTRDGRPSIAQYIKKILMVSDNDAFNRLYEFLGQEYINDQLHQRGYGDVQLLHRLSIPLSPDENRHTNPVSFLDANNNILYDQPMKVTTRQYLQRNDTVGKGFIRAGQLVNEPMDFSAKNRISLEDLHTILISLIFPNKVTAASSFNITAGDRDFLLKYMSQLPTESTYPPYSTDTANYWPAYCKFLLFGSEKGALPNNIRIFNKVGDAYGQLTDVAYIVDLDKKVEFFLSATIYCNEDGILNDDKYNYNDIGFPFMKHLGEIIYEQELKRNRKHIPDLSKLIFKYDVPPTPIPSR